VITVVDEGPSDAGFIEEVCRRVGVECRVLIARGNRVDKVARLIKAVAPRIVESIESWILAGLCEENPEGTPNPEARLRERGRVPS